MPANGATPVKPALRESPSWAPTEWGRASLPGRSASGRYNGNPAPYSSLCLVSCVLCLASASCGMRLASSCFVQFTFHIRHSTFDLLYFHLASRVLCLVSCVLCLAFSLFFQSAIPNPKSQIVFVANLSSHSHSPFNIRPSLLPSRLSRLVSCVLCLVSRLFSILSIRNPQFPFPYSLPLRSLPRPQNPGKAINRPPLAHDDEHLQPRR